VLSSAESGRGFGSVFHHHYSKKPTTPGWFFLLSLI
jgi:hypothetical protein